MPFDVEPSTGHTTGRVNPKKKGHSVGALRPTPQRATASINRAADDSSWVKVCQ